MRQRRGHPAPLLVRMAAATFVLALLSCAQEPRAGDPPGYGPAPVLPEPNPALIPTVNIAPATGWPEGATPQAARGLAVDAFARGLDHPRWLYVLPNGDVLVAETNAPKRPEAREGLKGWAMSVVMKRAGAAVPSADRITLLRDADGDGRAEVRTRFLENLHSPFGMALVGDALYVANTDAVVKFQYQAGATEIRSPGQKVADLPAGDLNYHWTKNILPSKDGARLYATVGSNSNVGENGMHEEERRAAILEIDLAAGDSRIFASGLRNPNGLDWQPDSGELWTAVNERDELGDNLVPDFITSVRDGGFYGWPYSYFGQHVDERVQPQRPELVAQAIAPDYAVGAHTSSMGLVFYTADLLPPRYRGGAFVGQHGSWNRSTPSGYRVIFVPFKNGEPAGAHEDVLFDFINDEGDARGRPVGVVVARDGALLVADDVGNAVWRVTPAPAGRARPAER